MLKTRVLRGGGEGGERWVAPVLTLGQPGAAAPLHEFKASAAPEVVPNVEAYDAGFARGREEGLQAVQAEMAGRLELLSSLVHGLSQPMAGLDEQVDEALATLALNIAQQVLRREIASDPQQIVAVVREARAALRDVQGTLRIVVHPDEAAAVRGMFSDHDGLSAVQVDEDPTLRRGGCIVSTDVSRVDARLETRVAQIAAQLLGDDRARDPAQ